MAKHFKEAQSKNGTEQKEKNSSLPLMKEESMPGKDNEVKSTQKAGEAGSENNVIIEELGPPSADVEPDEMFEQELQPTEGNYNPSPFLTILHMVHSHLHSCSWAKTLPIELVILFQRF